MYTETKEQSDFLKAQSPRKSKGKYKQVLRKKENGIDSEQHEYVTPSGEAGYSIILRAEKDGVKYIKTTGKGPEADSRNHDWQEVINEA